MSRIHGRSGQFYLSLTSGAAASPVAFMSGWSVTWSQTYTDVTPLGAPSRVWIPGQLDVSGTFTGWYDDATLQEYSAAVDGLPRSFYLYPNTANTSQFFQGVINIAEFDVTAGVAAAAAVSGSWTTNIAVTLAEGHPITLAHAVLAAATGTAQPVSAGSSSTNVSAGLAAATAAAKPVTPGGTLAGAGLASASGWAAVSVPGYTATYRATY